MLELGLGFNVGLGLVWVWGRQPPSRGISDRRSPANRSTEVTTRFFGHPTLILLPGMQIFRGRIEVRGTLMTRASRYSLSSRTCLSAEHGVFSRLQYYFVKVSRRRDPMT